MDVATFEYSPAWAPPAEREPVLLLATPPRSAAPIGVVNPQDDRARQLVTSVARAAVEALTGYRPMSQLTRWLAPSAVGGLNRAKQQGTWRGAKVTRVWASAPAADVIEGVAHVSVETRRLALPIRLERRDGQWQCTHLSMLLPGVHMIV